MAFKTKVNLAGGSTVYNKYYGGFRGVDFSSDHTQIADSRFAYALNMYKDYNSKQGQAIETIVGFRERFKQEGEVYGLHPFTTQDKSNLIIAHIGNKFYKCQGDSVSDLRVQANKHKSTSFIMNNRLYILDGANYWWYDGTALTKIDYSNSYLPTTRISIKPDGFKTDGGKEHEQMNLLSDKYIHTYVADGQATDYATATEVSQESKFFLESVYVYGTKINQFEGDPSSYNGDEMVWFPILANASLANGSSIQHCIVRFSSAPSSPSDMGKAEGYAGIEFVYKLRNGEAYVIDDENKVIDIKQCTLATVFDGRVFLSGHPKFPNHIFYSQRNSTGYNDPTYFGILNYQPDGVDNAPITGMIPMADTLAVLKSESRQDGTVFFHTPTETGNNIQPKTYPNKQGQAGKGCLGACINFLDDAVFVSRFGLEAIGSLSIRLERAIEHRSSMVDSVLLNTDLKGAMIEEWNGYLLLLLPDGEMFMADSRQRWQDQMGAYQYEWYYLEGIGEFKDQYLAYKPYRSWDGIDFLKKEKVSATVGETSAGTPITEEFPLEIETEDSFDIYVNPPNSDGSPINSIQEASITDDDTNTTYTVSYYIKELRGWGGEIVERHAILCYTDGEQIGGQFRKPTCLKVINDNIYFGTKDGAVYSFNFDKRNEDGTFDSEWYTFNGRVINCGVATKMDCCDIPHLSKSTIRKSLVIKTKTYERSVVKAKVRTNKSSYNQIARISSSVFDFGNLDLSSLSFRVSESELYGINEKEKRWIEKQYYIYSDEYKKPFALYYISYRYKVAGRYKE